MSNIRERDLDHIRDGDRVLMLVDLACMRCGKRDCHWIALNGFGDYWYFCSEECRAVGLVDGRGRPFVTDDRLEAAGMFFVNPIKEG